MSQTNKDSDSVRSAVRNGYSQIAQTGNSCCGSGSSCCGPAGANPQQLAQHIGYSTAELRALPEGANMGLSCGNPNALAELKPGEVVLDLGSGGGFDVFIAGRKVGATGRAIGIDMTPDMLTKARKNVADYHRRTDLDNVEFRLGEIEHLPVADNSVDVIISNCVINLSPDKPQVWREMARVLKPGGRVAVSDLALLKPLPSAIAEMVEALIGCVAGAVLTSETEQMAKDAGLSNITLNSRPSYVEGMVDWQDPLYQKIMSHLPAETKPADYITSLEITATKPEPSGAVLNSTNSKNTIMSELEIYDPAMCCSTGICGPEVDPKLVQFAADVKWLQDQGVEVQRFNLSQTPAAFVENEVVNTILAEKGEEALPLLLLNGTIVTSGRYPERSELGEMFTLKSASSADDDSKSSCCCGGDC